MADETKPAPVTDSRFPGFNPEVEASHAEANAAQAKAAAEAAAAAPQPPPPPTPTHHCDSCGAMHLQAMETCTVCGASGRVVKL